MENEFHPGKPPEDRLEEINGLRRAVDSTKIRISEFESSNANASELYTHLKDLKDRLERAIREKEEFDKANRPA